MPVDTASRDEFLARMQKEFGEESVIRGVELAALPPLKVPFISPMLTWATTGGVPWGHVCRWYGPEHSGKSLTNWGLLWCAQHYHEVLEQQYEYQSNALQASGNKIKAKVKRGELKKLLELYPEKLTAMVYDTEGRADMHFMQALGLDPAYIELSSMTIVENICAGIHDGWGSFHIQIVDSASAAQSMQEAGISPGEYTQGSGPQAWTKWLKQALKGRDRRENCLIIVDQLRSQLGTARKGKGQQGEQATPPGIRALRHAASVAIEYQTAKRLYRDKNGNLTDDWEKADTNIRSLGTDGKEPHGVEMSCKVIKNSTGRPWRNAKMRFAFPVMDHRTGEVRFPIGFDEPWELLEIAVYFDIIEKGGGGMHYVLDEDFEQTGEKYKGESPMRNALAEDDELRERILLRMYRDF